MKDTVTALMARPKGILAADESFPSIKKRFEKIGIESTDHSRWAYRNMLLTSPGIEQYISGVIMFDETFREANNQAVPFPKYLLDLGIMPGIKVDAGTGELPNFEEEKITYGLDGLDERFKEYAQMGAKFSKWRAVITIGSGSPSDYAISANIDALVRYAALSQQSEIVPIIEPEVLMDGDHNIETCSQITLKVHQILFERLKQAKISLENTILKTNMVVAGKDNPNQPSADQVADQTVKCLKSGVPTNIGGIVFLSGGLDEDTSTQYLNEINKIASDAPWRLTFSYGRALQNSALKMWIGKEENVAEAQEKFLERAKANSMASVGEYGNS